MCFLRGSIFPIFVVALVLSLAMAGPAPGDDEHEHKMMKKMCAGEELKFPMPDDGMKKELETCHSDACHPLCVAKVIGVVDDKGMLIQEEVMDRITEVAPPSKVGNIKKAVDTCIEQHGKMLDMQKCDTYKNLVQCAVTGITPICDWKD